MEACKPTQPTPRSASGSRRIKPLNKNRIESNQDDSLSKAAFRLRNFLAKAKKLTLLGRHGKSVRDQDFGWRLVRELTRSLGTGENR